MNSAIQINEERRGTLGVVEFSNLPFIPRRTFWITCVPPSETRGHHAHHRCEQFILPLNGSVEFSVTNIFGESREGKLVLGDGLHLSPYEWIVLKCFSENSVVMVFCSEPYDASDYITDFDEFLSGPTA